MLPNWPNSGSDSQAVSGCLTAAPAEAQSVESLEDSSAPRCSKYGANAKKTIPKITIYKLYKPSPNGTSMALGLPGNTTLPQHCHSYHLLSV